MGSPVHIVKGRVDPALLPEGFRDVRVEARPVGRPSVRAVAWSRIRTDGTFEIRIPTERVSRLGLEKVRLSFRVKAGDRQLIDTSDTTTVELGPEPKILEVHLSSTDVNGRLSPTPDSHEASDDALFGGHFIVQGTVTGRDDLPLSGVLVKVHDQGLKAANPLGEPATTDERGFYSIAYTRDQLRDPERGSANLVVTATGQASTAESGVVFAAGALEVIDLHLDELAKTSQLDRVVTSVTPALAGVELGQLTEEDVKFLSADTGVASDEIALLAKSASLAGATKLPSAFFYALGKERLPLDLDTLTALHPRLVREAASRAVADGIIPPSPDGVDLEQALASFEELSRTRVLEGGAEG
jgi:hypothetical protein